MYSINKKPCKYRAFPGDLSAVWRIAITYLTRAAIDIIDVTKVNIL